jgi:hypothetical protein
MSENIWFLFWMRSEENDLSPHSILREEGERIKQRVKIATILGLIVFAWVVFGIKKPF